jgi:excisionase family DNA binding protein
MTSERAAKFLRAPAAARYLGVSLRTFYDHVRAHVPAVRIGTRVVFDPADLDAFAETRKVAPTGPSIVPLPTRDERLRKASPVTTGQPSSRVQKMINLMRGQVAPQAAWEPPGRIRIREKKLKEIKS